jgi:hypothetical protein
MFNDLIVLKKLEIQILKNKYKVKYCSNYWVKAIYESNF